jgi:hypothetical protein
MKHLCVLFLILCYFSAFAQNTRNCVTPISNFAFQQLLTNISAKQDESQKLNFSKKIVRENCLSTDQVKQIAELFSNDYNKLTFVEQAYEVTTDKDNFYEVYNSFSYFSTVFRLHDYIAERKSGTQIVIDEPQTDVMTFPLYDYPEYKKYFGKPGCTNNISESEFQVLADKIFKEPSEDRKLYFANTYAVNNCMQTAYIMKMASLLKNESNRLDFLKKAYNKVYDPDNYRYASQVFSSEPFKKDFNTFLGNKISVNTNNDPPCEVSQQDFATIKNQIAKQSMINTKINIAKMNIKTKKCFKTDQIIEILALFPYSDSKMDIAKFAYDYTNDKENYIKVADCFTFTSDKDVFLNFLKTK